MQPIFTHLNDGVIQEINGIIDFHGQNELNLFADTNTDKLPNHIYMYMYLKDVILDDTLTDYDEELTAQIKSVYLRNQKEIAPAYIICDDLMVKMSAEKEYVKISFNGNSIYYFMNCNLDDFNIRESDIHYLKTIKPTNLALTINTINSKMRSACFQPIEILHIYEKRS